MGYASTDIVFYGVLINFEKAEKLQPKIYTEDGNMDPAPGMPDGQDLGYGYNQYAGTVQIMADGADSCIDQCHGCYCPEEPEYEYIGARQFQYAFGIFIASKGYAYGNNIVKAIKNEPSEKVKALWDKHCAPLLTKDENRPEIIQINQTR